MQNQFKNRCYLVLAIVTLLLSCSKDDSNNSSEAAKIKELTVDVVLPEGSTIYANSLKLSSLFTESANISNAEGKIESFSEESIELTMATNSQGNVIMLSYFNPLGNDTIVMNSESTAIALVMMHPWTSDLSVKAKEEAFIYIKNLPEFQSYKETIANSIATGELDPLSNQAVFDKASEIQNLVFNRVNGYKEPLEFSTENSTVSIKNVLSSATYSVGLYDKNNVFIEQKLAKGLDKTHFIFQEFKNNIFQETKSNEQIASFTLPKDGEWTLKAKSGLSFDSSKENEEAVFHNTMTLGANAIGIFSTKLKEIFKNKKCYISIGDFIYKGVAGPTTISESLKKYDSRTITGYELSLDFLKFTLSQSKGLLDLIINCDPEGAKEYGIDKIKDGVFGKLLKIIDVSGRLKNVFNSSALLTDWIQFNKEIDFCFEKKDNQITECSNSCGNVTDIDGNVYPTVKIGTQCWMQKNLNVSRYRNGDPLPQVSDQTQWAALTTGAWCYYENKTANGSVYGKLYNWYAVNDPRGLAPAGWHVPSDSEWTTLTTFLGGQSVAGGKMKATTGWNSPNIDATNSSGFTGLPGGYRSYFGAFGTIGNFGDWWSSSEYDAAIAWIRDLNYFSDGASRERSGKENGFSVRCLRD